MTITVLSGKYHFKNKKRVPRNPEMLKAQLRTMNKMIIPAMVAIVTCSGFMYGAQPKAPKASMDRGKKVYETVCLTCHQVDGLGVPRMNPPLVNTKWVLGPKKDLARIVLKGLKGGEIEIDGDSFHNPMPPQESNLSDLQIADVLTYVRNSFGNKASAVTPADVKAARAIKP
jgi:mono/diheme cytochrome c family protein